MPKLSLCMIVKNEEEMLPDCLESVEGIVDEIILVDTGSTDKTVEIAQQFGATQREQMQTARSAGKGKPGCRMEGSKAKNIGMHFLY